MSETFRQRMESPLSERRSRGSEQRDTVLLTDATEPVSPSATSLNPGSAVLAALKQRYEILAEAGHGNMGNVYKARDLETGEIVALKLMKPEIASDARVMERFKNELLFARKITHKNVCRVYEFNRIDGVAYTSMEFVKGESLRSELEGAGGHPLSEAMNYALQICSGLKEAHAQGIVHRDLKPENVMVDANGNVKIMDFGIARSMEAATKLTGAMVGTPAYMAPEQVAGKSVDYRTDIYSLGLMLYEMFTGQPAFISDSPIAMAVKQLRESAPAPHDVAPTIAVGIERTILKCLEKEPAKRFQSIRELEKALSSPEAGSPVPVSAGVAPTPTRPEFRATPAPNVATPQFAFITQEPARRMSPLLWLGFGAAIVLGVVAGTRAFGVIKAANEIPPPAQPAAPVPDFALEKVAPVNNGAATPQPNLTVPQPANPPTIKSSERPEGKPPATPAFKPSRHDAAPAAAQPKAAAPSSDESAKQETDRVSPRNGAFPNASYIWVGRFAREDKAQEAAKKIEDLSLPVVVIPRHTPEGQFFAVFTGPYNEKKLESVTERLKSKGFTNVRRAENPFQPPGAMQKP